MHFKAILINGTEKIQGHFVAEDFDNSSLRAGTLSAMESQLASVGDLIGSHITTVLGNDTWIIEVEDFNTVKVLMPNDPNGANFGFRGHFHRKTGD